MASNGGGEWDEVGGYRKSQMVSEHCICPPCRVSTACNMWYSSKTTCTHPSHHENTSNIVYADTCTQHTHIHTTHTHVHTTHTHAHTHTHTCTHTYTQHAHTHVHTTRTHTHMYTQHTCTHRCTCTQHMHTIHTTHAQIDLQCNGQHAHTHTHTHTHTPPTGPLASRCSVCLKQVPPDDTRTVAAFHSAQEAALWYVTTCP